MMESMTRAWWMLVLASVCCGQVSVAPPSIGVIRDSSGHLRRVYGAAGAFVLGPPEVSAVSGTDKPEREVTISGRTVRLEKDSLLIRQADGAVKRISLAGVHGELQRMGDGWLWADPFAIRLIHDGAEIFRLPAAEAAR